MNTPARYAVIALLPLLYSSPAAQTGATDPETVAARLLAAPKPDRDALLTNREMHTPALAKALIALGDQTSAKGEYARALVAFESAGIVARRAGADSELGRALNGIAAHLFALTELDRAKAAAEESVRFHERTGDLNGQAEAWNTINNILFYKGEHAEALAALEKARELWERAGNRIGVARTLGNAGNIHKSADNLDAAAALYEQSLAIFQELDDRGRAGTVMGSIGIIHYNRGDYAQALDWIRKALALHEAVGYRPGISRGLDSLGHVYRAQGAYGRAMDAFQRSLETRRALGDRFAVAESENNIGLLHFSQGDYQLAIDAYKRGLREASQAGTARMLEPESLTNIGGAAWRLGQTERARANFRQSLAISERENWKKGSAANLHALASLALEAGGTREADEMFRRALAIREELKDQAGMVEALNGLARLHLATGRIGDALSFAERSTDIATRSEQIELLWEAHTLRGIAHRRLGQVEGARSALHEAIAGVERLRDQVAGAGLGRERFFETKLSPYHELTALALADGSPAEALEIAERAKGRGLADLVRRRHAIGIGRGTIDESSEERRLRLTLVGLNQRILAERTKTSPDDQRIRTLEAERQTARSEYEGFQVALYARNPELRVQRGDAAPFAFREATPLVPDAATAVLEYVVADESAYLFVLTRSNGRIELDSYTLKIGRKPLTTRVRRLRERLAARDLLFAQDARELYDLLLAPAKRELAGKTRLVLIPDGPLWETPFQALRDPAGHYVVQSAVVSYAPSLTILRESLRNAPRRDGPPTLLAMGKADFGSKSARPAVLMSDLLPLPEAERQVRLLPKIYGPERSVVYLGPDATEARFKAEAPRHRIVHVASHGLLDERSPLYSSVVLSTKAGETSEDGLLEAWEMLDLKLAADLVILSACETGRGRIASGEGLVGTMWALFAAGAQATVASQWKVEASSTTELMVALHRRLVRGDVSKADALRRATLEVLENPRYVHPFYWAPFVLVGNPF